VGRVVAVKNVDEELYRKFKAMVALKGLTIGEALNQALSLWIRASENIDVVEYLETVKEAEANRRIYRELEDYLIRNHAGKYVAVACGKLLGIFDSREEALRAVRKVKSRHAIVTRVEPKKTRVIELGMSLFEVVE